MKDNNVSTEEVGVKELENQSKKSFDCGKLKIEIKPGKTTKDNWVVYWKLGEESGVIDPQFIWVMAWMISNDQMKDKLIPVKTQELRVFYKTIKLQLRQDMKAGSTVMANVKFKVPMELLVEASNSGIFTPKK